MNDDKKVWWESLQGILANINILGSLEKIADRIQIGGRQTTIINNGGLIIGEDILRDSEKSKALDDHLAKLIDSRLKLGYFAIPESQKRLETSIPLVRSSDEVTFFEGKIPPQDLQILKIAITHENYRLLGDKAEADRIKGEATRRYGTLASNILNIHSVGYFRSLLMPLYEILEETGGDGILTAFQDMYRIIVQESAFTLFVASIHSINELREKCAYLIEKNKAYGAYKIIIHGINDGNVKKIKTLVGELKSQIEGDPIIFEKGDAITVRMNLKRGDGVVYERPGGEILDLI